MVAETVISSILSDHVESVIFPNLIEVIFVEACAAEAVVELAPSIVAVAVAVAPEVSTLISIRYQVFIAKVLVVLISPDVPIVSSAKPAAVTLKEQLPLALINCSIVDVTEGRFCR